MVYLFISAKSSVLLELCGQESPESKDRKKIRSEQLMGSPVLVPEPTPQVCASVPLSGPARSLQFSPV